MQNKYHAWCYKMEQDPMHDFYYIQSARAKLDKIDEILLKKKEDNHIGTCFIKKGNQKDIILITILGTKYIAAEIRKNFFVIKERLEE
jgi:hypothetical protein